MMKNWLLLLGFCLSLHSIGLAQKGLEGLWEGSITRGGIHSSIKLPFQLYLTVEGNRLNGRTYVTIEEGKTVQMELRGRLYQDFSIELLEVKFIGDERNSYFPKFNRQYQIRWKRDLWDAQLIGFWQEVTGETFGAFRERGRLELRKKKGDGA